MHSADRSAACLRRLWCEETSQLKVDDGEALSIPLLMKNGEFYFEDEKSGYHFVYIRPVIMADNWLRHFYMDDQN